MFKGSIAFLQFINTTEACQCFANHPDYQSLCEGSRHSGNVDWCLSHEDCHWGPADDAECKLEEANSETSKCHCLANEAGDEDLCAQGLDKLSCQL